MIEPYRPGLALPAGDLIGKAKVAEGDAAGALEPAGDGEAGEDSGAGVGVGLGLGVGVGGGGMMFSQ